MHSSRDKEDRFLSFVGAVMLSDKSLLRGGRVREKSIYRFLSFECEVLKTSDSKEVHSSALESVTEELSHEVHLSATL